MKTEGRQKGSGYSLTLPWYPYIKLLGILLGTITMLGELFLLAHLLIVKSINQALFILFLGCLLVGVMELTLWFWSRTLLFSFPQRPSSSKRLEKPLVENALGTTGHGTLAPTPLAYSTQKHTTQNTINYPALPDPHTMPTRISQQSSYNIRPTAIILQADTSDPNTDIPVYKTLVSLPSRLDPAITSISSKARSYAVTRERGLAHSEDRKAHNNNQTRYALADGVGTSFLPGHWAEIVTREFVDRNDDFLGQEDFEDWLSDCSKKWNEWVNEKWVPAAVERSGQLDWSRDIERGASATFVGCSFSRDQLMQMGETKVHVTVVGDAVFFLVSPSSEKAGTWHHTSFRLENADDFAQQTETLGSPSRRIKRDWKRVYQKDFLVRNTDTLVLASDAIAQWIMRDKDPWNILFHIANEGAFAEIVDHYRSNGAMEVDDTTITIIPLQYVDSHRIEFK